MDVVSVIFAAVGLDNVLLGFVVLMIANHGHASEVKKTNVLNGKKMK